MIFTFELFWSFPFYLQIRTYSKVPQNIFAQKLTLDNVKNFQFEQVEQQFKQHLPLSHTAISSLLPKSEKMRGQKIKGKKKKRK